MTKEELKNEAEESFEQYKVTDEDYVVSPYSDDMGEKMLMYNNEYYAEEIYLRLYTQGYLAGAEPREKRIAELEQKLEQTENDLADYQFNYPTIKELQKENAELKSENQKWKDEWQEQVQKATDEGYARTLQTIQLNKTKELLTEFVHHYKAKTIYIENMQDLLEQAEQFLNSEVDK